MRLVFESAPEAERTALYERFSSGVAEPLSMEYRFAEAGGLPRIAVMASKEQTACSICSGASARVSFPASRSW